MSSSNNTSSSSSSSTTTAAYPTQGNSFDALKYNINEKFSWYLGDPTPQEIYLYSNLAWNGSNNSYYIFNQDPTTEPLFTQYSATYSDSVLSNAVSADLTYTGTISVTTLSPTDYATAYAKLDGLFGISWFPWNVFGLKNSDGNYCVRQYANGDPIQANPMCWGVVEIKAITLLKLSAIGAGVFFGGKLIYKYAMKK